MQKPLCEITELETDQYLYRCDGKRFDWIVPPDKHSIYYHKSLYTLGLGDFKVATVTKYQIIDIEPIPAPDECRRRIKELIDKMPDNQVLGEYLEIEDVWD